jgi:mono/diheme cytochrome c family protein
MMRTSLFIANLTLLFFIEPVSALDAQTLFSQQCSQCHGATLRGSAHGTSLKGQIFKDTWATQNWQALASLSSTTMPPGEPDRLSTAEHAALAKFIFTSNGLPVDAEAQQDESQETTGSDS